jgi:thiol-disulfide isomerase/thioredoxin
MQKIRVLIYLVVMQFIASSCALKPTPSLSPQSFAFRDLGGKTYNSGAFSGSPVLLHFWASWCIPCIGEITNLQKFADQLFGLPFHSVAIAVNDTPDSVALMLRENKSSLLVLIDPNGESKHLFNLTRLPYTILLDSTGKQIPLPSPITGKLLPALLGAQAWSSPQATEYYRQYLSKLDDQTKRGSDNGRGSAESP